MARPRSVEALLELADAALQGGWILAVAVAVAIAFAIAVEAADERVGLPPVDAHLAGAVDRGHHEAHLDREQLDVEQADLDVAHDDDALVEHALEDVGEALGGAVCGGLPVADEHRRLGAGLAHRSSTWDRRKRRTRR